MKQGYVYILTNVSNKVLYIGVTIDLIGRVYKHKNKLVKGFTEKYNCNKLVYFETGDDIEGCIVREKQLKKGTRQRKINLINSMNPEWDDLYDSLL